MPATEFRRQSVVGADGSAGRRREDNEHPKLLRRDLSITSLASCRMRSGFASLRVSPLTPVRRMMELGDAELTEAQTMALEEIEAIWKREYQLQPFLDEKTFKPYEELEIVRQRPLAKLFAPHSQPSVFGRGPWRATRGARGHDRLHVQLAEFSLCLQHLHRLIAEAQVSHDPLCRNGIGYRNHSPVTQGALLLSIFACLGQMHLTSRLSNDPGG
jgi:hypothetical protein